MSVSGILSGIALCIIGTVLIVAAFISKPMQFVMIIPGLILLITGIYMIVRTNEEDKVEEIRKK